MINKTNLCLNIFIIIPPKFLINKLNEYRQSHHRFTRIKRKTSFRYEEVKQKHKESFAPLISARLDYKNSAQLNYIIYILTYPNFCVK